MRYAGEMVISKVCRSVDDTQGMHRNSQSNHNTESTLCLFPLLKSYVNVLYTFKKDAVPDYPSTKSSIAFNSRYSSAKKQPQTQLQYKKRMVIEC